MNLVRTEVNKEVGNTSAIILAESQIGNVDSFSNIA